MNFVKRNQSLNFVIFFFLFSLFVTIASELAMGLLSTSFVKVLGKNLDAVSGCDCPRFSLGILWNTFTRPYGVFCIGRLSNWHVANV